MTPADAKEPHTKAVVERAMADGLSRPGDGRAPDPVRRVLRDGKKHFDKADRGVWPLTDAGKARVAAIRKAFATK